MAFSPWLFPEDLPRAYQFFNDLINALNAPIKHASLLRYNEEYP
jgi:hypothetical protein